MFGLDGGKVLGLGLSLKTWAYIVVAAIAAAGCIATTSYAIGHGAGKVAGIASKQKEVDGLKDAAAKRDREAAAALAKLNKQLHDKEKAHEQEVADLRAEFAAQDAAARAADASALADLRSGNHQLRLRVAACGLPGPGQAGPASAGAAGEATAQLAPETAAALYSIAADGDAAIRRANALNDWADSAVKLCNGSVK